jgi:hypothetical protein
MPSTAPDREALDRKRVEEALREYRRAMGRRDLAEAERSLKEGLALAQKVRSEERARLYESRAELATVQQDHAETAAAAEKWLLSCGPDAADRCRRAALGVLKRVARTRKDAKASARVAAIETADACVLRA